MPRQARLMLAGHPYHVTQRGVNKGAIYVQAFNKRHGRSGPFWQGRFHSSMVDSDAYLLSVYRYIERNPVRAGIAIAAEDHPWSSVHGNLQRRDDPLLTPHPAFQALAPTRCRRTTLYANFLKDANASADVPVIRTHCASQRPLGDTTFLRMVEETLGRTVELRRPGRPRKKGTGKAETT